MITKEEFETYFIELTNEFYSTPDEYKIIREAYEIYSRSERQFNEPVKDIKKLQQPYINARETILDLFNKTGQLSLLEALDDIDKAITSLSHTKQKIKIAFKKQAQVKLSSMNLLEYKIQKVFQAFNTLLADDPYLPQKLKSNPKTKYEQIVEKSGIKNPTGRELVEYILLTNMQIE